MNIFLDSSAIVKRYIEESGSSRVAEILRDAGEITICIICVPETISACNRLLREGKIGMEQYQWIKKEFLLDIKEFETIGLTEDVLKRSIDILEKGALRSLDAMHIAAAIEYGPDLFITGDIRQSEIAATLGLKMELV